MIIEIEYYKGDVLLYGQKISYEELKQQFETVENLYDKTVDNFVALLCRMYHWKILEDDMQPQFIYDRDIKKCICIR